MFQQFKADHYRVPVVSTISGIRVSLIVAGIQMLNWEDHRT